MAMQFLKTADGEMKEVQLEAIAGDARDLYGLRCGDEAQEQLDVMTLGPGRGWIRLHGRVTPFFTTRRDGDIQVWMNGRIHSVQVVDRTARRSHAAASQAARAELLAPMPGTILKINLSAGDAFEAHQPLIVMESMKMEMTLSAPHAGKMKEVTCRPGQLVEMGAVLARLIPDSEPTS